MKIFRTVLTTGLLLSALPAFAGETVTAELPKESAKPSCEGRFDTKLRLTDEQRSKLGALRDQYTLDTAGKKAQLEVSFRQMHELLRQPTIDKQAVLNLEAKINSLKTDLSTARINVMLASSDVFTAEQRAQFSKMMEWRGHCEGGHHGRKHEGGREMGRGKWEHGPVGFSAPAPGVPSKGV